MWNEQGCSVAAIARTFNANEHYVRQIVHGESRQVENSGTRHAAPIVSPKDYPEAYLKGADGHLWKKRGRGPGRLMPAIPFTTIVQIRETRKLQGLSAYALSVQFGVSPSYVKKILAMKVRVSA